jgi:serine phosphatase RsbU (regulator of sigma subunit)
VTPLLLFTDGLTEARHSRILLEQTRMEEIARGCARLSSSECADHLIDAATRFAAGRLRDDVALLVVRCPPPSLPGQEEAGDRAGSAARAAIT